MIDLLFKAVPFKPWQDLLLRRHVDRCPACQARLAGREETRAVLAREEDFRGGADLWPKIKAGLAGTAELPRRPARTGWGLARAAVPAAVLLAAAVLSIWFARGFRAVSPSAAVLPVEGRFEMDYVRIAGQPAESYIFQSRDSGMTLVWAEKKNQGGVR